MLPKVSIVILNFDGLKWTPACLATIKKNTTYPHEIVIVDNASTDGSREWLEQNQKLFPNLTIHYNEKRDSGYAEGINTALEYCKNPYVLLLNNDILIPDSRWLTSLIQEMENNPTIGIEGCKLVYPTELLQHAGVLFGIDSASGLALPFHRGRNEPKEKYTEKQFMPAVTFACALIKRELLINGLDTTYKFGNYEDTDFCCKTRKDGWNILYNGEVWLYHYEGATQLTIQDRKFVMENFQKFSSRWNNWLIEDMNLQPKLHNPEGKQSIVVQ